jgi:hypothetical protein
VVGDNVPFSCAASAGPLHLSTTSLYAEES